MGPLKRLFSATLIFLLSFQLCFAETLVRLPAQVNVHDLSLDELNERISAFKVRISGREEMPDCGPAAAASFDTPPAQNATPVDYFLNRITVNACSEATFTYVNTEQDNTCDPVKTPGLIDELVEATMLKEINGEEPDAFRLDDPVVRELHKEAEYLLGETRKYFYNNRVDRRARQELLINYLDSVTTRMRDLIVVKRSYMDEQEYDGRYFYTSLIPEFPASMIRQGDMIEVSGMPQSILDVISKGPNPNLEPFEFDIIDRGMGRLTLEYRELEILSRDMLMLLKAPSSQNYMRALKWMTLQMMLSQIQIYKAASNDFTPTKLPASCTAHRNGDLPENFHVRLDEEFAREYVEGLLFSHGLLFDETDVFAHEYFLENIDRDPTKDGYAGVIGFEEYQTAKVGLNGRSRGPMRAVVDDIAHFERVFQMKFPEALDKYKGEIRPARSRRRSSSRATPRRIHYAGVDEFNKIVSEPSEYEIFEVQRPNGRTFTLDAQRQGLSTFLAEAMVREGVLSFEELISPELERELKSRTIRHEFPPLHGPHVWRQWGLGLLSEVLHLNKDVPRNHPVARAVEQVCYTLPFNLRDELCVADRNRQQPVLGWARKLDEYRALDEFLPLRRVQEDKLEVLYPHLAHLWNNLRDRTDVLAEATTNEYEYLIDQMNASNPWARMRLGYLIHKDELVRARNSHEPVLVRQGRRNRHAPQTRCLYTQLDQRIQKLDAAARSLGINRPLRMFYADSMLSNREREYLWQQIVESVHEGNAQLFTENIQGREAYDILNELSYKTFLTRESVDAHLQKFPPLDSLAQEELDRVLSDENNELRMDLFKLYEMRGNPEQQMDLLESIFRRSGHFDTLRVKLSFLMLDSDLKAPLMKNIIRKAADQRKAAITENLEQFCNLEPDDFENFRALFYATTKAQNRINEMAGLPQVPEQILDKINSMSPDEWTNMFLGIGAGLLGVAAILVGGACTAVTAGICAPISVALIAAGAASISMQLVLLSREYDMKRDADRLEAQVQMMEDLGFAGPDSAYQVSRTWFWTALEAAFIIPLVGLSLRIVKVNGKMVYVSTSHALRGTPRATFKEAARTTLAEADVRFARYKLGMDNLGNSLTIRSLAKTGEAGVQASSELTTLLIRQGVPEEVVTRAFRDIENTRHLFATGKISMDTMISQMTRILDPLTASLRGSTSVLARSFGAVVVNESKQVIDRRTAEVVASFFGHNPDGLLRVVQSHTGKRLGILKPRLEVAAARMAKVTNGTGLANRIPVFRNLVNWFRKLRSEDLLKHADSLARVERDLIALSRTGGDLQQYIAQNIDVLTDVFVNMPLRKRELPYFIMVLGGPSFGGRMAGKSIPGLTQMTDGFMLRQFFNARSRLVYESFKAEAREVLRLPRVVASESTYTAYKAFQYSVQDALSTLPEAQARVLARELTELEGELAQRLFQNITSRNANGTTFRFRQGAQVHRLNPEEVRRILFNPATMEEKALAEVIWASNPTDALLGLEKLSTVAHRAVQELANYKTADQFQNYLSALKILVLKRDPAVVQFF
jgi:hypothetical protein